MKKVTSLAALLVFIGFQGDFSSARAATCPAPFHIANAINGLLVKAPSASKIIGDDMHPSPTDGRWVVAHIEGDLPRVLSDKHLTSAMGLEKSMSRTFLSRHEVLKDYVAAKYKICYYYYDSTEAYIYMGQKPGDENK